MAAAAVTARIQAMDAVANNFGVDSGDIKREQDREDREREREKEREREQREKKRESKDMKNTHRDRSKDPSPARQRKSRETPPSPPPERVAPAAPVGDLQTAQAELEKKLREAGTEDSEAATLSQQENLQIKGQSARKLVMQKLIGGNVTYIIIRIYF